MADTTTRQIDGTLGVARGPARMALSGAERQARYRQRLAQGAAAQMATCNGCSTSYEPQRAGLARRVAGLCSSCWKATPEAQTARRKADRRRYWSDPARRADVRVRVARHRASKRTEEAGQ